MPLAGFEPTIPAGELPQNYALDRAATGTGATVIREIIIIITTTTTTTTTTLYCEVQYFCFKKVYYSVIFLYVACTTGSLLGYSYCLSVRTTLCPYSPDDRGTTVYAMGKRAL